MSIKKIFGLLAILGSAATISASDVQAYPGVQFRVQQSFVDLIAEEFFFQLPYIVNTYINPLLPTEIDLFLGFFKIQDIKLSNFVINTERAKFTIDE